MLVWKKSEWISFEYREKWIWKNFYWFIKIFLLYWLVRLENVGPCSIHIKRHPTERYPGSETIINRLKEINTHEAIGLGLAQISFNFLSTIIRSKIYYLRDKLLSKKLITQTDDNWQPAKHLNKEIKIIKRYQNFLLWLHVIWAFQINVWWNIITFFIWERYIYATSIYMKIIAFCDMTAYR